MPVTSCFTRLLVCNVTLAVLVLHVVLQSLCLLGRLRLLYKLQLYKIRYVRCTSAKVPKDVVTGMKRLDSDHQKLHRLVAVWPRFSLYSCTIKLWFSTIESSLYSTFLSWVRIPFPVMTEYDYSPEAFERHMQTQARIARWVDDTQSHKEEFRNPFQYVPPTPQLGDTPLAPLSPQNYTRARSKSLHRPRASRSQTTPQPIYYPMPPPPPQSMPLQPIPILAPMPIPTQQQQHVRPHQLSTRSQTYALAGSYYPQQPHATMPPHPIIFQPQPHPQQYNYNINANQHRSNSVPVIPMNPIPNAQYQYHHLPGSNSPIPVSVNSDGRQMQMQMVPYQHPHQHQKQPPLLQRLLSSLTGSNKNQNGRGNGNGKKKRKARRRSVSY